MTKNLHNRREFTKLNLINMKNPKKAKIKKMKKIVEKKPGT